MGPKGQKKVQTSTTFRETPLTGLVVLQNNQNKLAHNIFYDSQMGQIEYDTQWKSNFPNLLKRTNHHSIEAPTRLIYSDVLVIRMRIQHQLEVENLVYPFNGGLRDAPYVITDFDCAASDRLVGYNLKLQYARDIAVANRDSYWASQLDANPDDDQAIWEEVTIRNRREASQPNLPSLAVVNIPIVVPEGVETDPNIGILSPSDDITISSVPSVADLIQSQDANVLAALNTARVLASDVIRVHSYLSE